MLWNRKQASQAMSRQKTSNLNTQEQIQSSMANMLCFCEVYASAGHPTFAGAFQETREPCNETAVRMVVERPTLTLGQY